RKDESIRISITPNIQPQKVAVVQRLTVNGFTAVMLIACNIFQKVMKHFFSIAAIAPLSLLNEVIGTTSPPMPSPK
ncbi:MAG TPA: hypothetical protein PLU53_15875, partial [Bacteroidia bacterium]|nr:hypothetical protein [Bacteroidia bacterium]